VGPLFVFLALAFVIHTEIFLHESIATEGTITALMPKQDGSDASVTYAPMFTFTAKDRQSYTVTSNASANPPEFKVGEKIRVLYEPDRPDGARIDSFWQLWSLAMIFGIVGTVTTGAGYLILRLGRRRGRTSPAAA
jgi:Protein of unknown function (DUF3592)